MLNEVRNVLETVSDEEQDCMDNYPENLQGTEKYEQMEDTVDVLNDAIEKIDDAIGRIQLVLGI